MEQLFQNSSEKAARLLGTAQGKALLRALRDIPSDTVNAIRAAAEAGDTQKAMGLLAPFLSDPRIAAVLSGGEPHG